MTTSAPLIQLDKVSVSYRKRAGFMRWKLFWALQDVSFELHQGETLGVIGRNGSGKSTLLRLLAGIISPDRGEVKTQECSVSMLGLQVGFIPHLSGRENAILSGMFLGMPKSEVVKRLDAIMAFSELDGFFDEPVKSYSMGMRARLGFATAIQIDPDVLLIDEVLGVGDAVFRKKSTAAIKDKINSNKTVVLVSHNLATLEETCQRLVWIEKGKLVEVGPTADILEKYNSTG